jgi:hypothetical protein
MTESYKIFPLKCQPGIKKDGTSTEGNYWNDGLWTRFYRGLPRSILGYRSMTQAYPGPSRGCFVDLNPTGFLDIFSGSANNLTAGQFTTAGFGSGVTDITPSGFPTSPANVWQLDSFYNDNGGGSISLIAHAAPNLVDISSNIATPVYYGNIDSFTALTAAQNDLSQTFEVSGGILALSPYVIAYGSLGFVQWSALNDPTTYPVANSANPCATKIVKGLAIPNASNPPSCLLWSLDSLIQMSFVGGDVIWDFNTISDQSSILSSSCPVEMDGIYYWIGVDRFLTYNGVLRELPNEMNLDFFFTNLNFAQRQKVFGFKVPRWSEIWWCAPLFGATECNYAVIYNVRENSWYSTPLPSDGRSAAYFAQSWQYPILFGANSFSGGYNLWQSEFMTDQIIGNTTNAIQSYVMSAPLSLVSGGLTVFGNPAAAQPQWTQLAFFEPDFNFGSSLTANIFTREYAQDTDTLASTINIIPGTNIYDNQTQARYIRWQFVSNMQGGFYQMGTPMIYFREGDRQP